MDFVDSTVVRLADPALRGALFDDVALQQVLSAGYDVETLGIDAPFAPVFDEVQIGVSAGGMVRVDGEWHAEGAGTRTIASFEVFGLASTAPRLDVLWKGAIRATTTFAAARIEKVGVRRADLTGIDDEIRANGGGALPDDPVQLEAQRRARVVTRLKKVVKDVNVASDDAVDRWLRSAGASTVGELLDKLAGNTGAGGVQITFTPAPAGPPVATPRTLPITAAILVRDAGTSIAQLLDETRQLEHRLAKIGISQPPDPAVRRRRDFVVIWMLPGKAFDDAGWPGSVPGMTAPQARDARRAIAGKWMAREGIGLVAVS